MATLYRSALAREPPNRARTSAADPAGGDSPATRSLPLDRRRWLRRDVVDDPVDAGHLVDDPAGDLAEHVVRELGPVGRHPVLGRHGPDRDDVRIGPPVAHDADTPHRGEDREALPERSVQAGALDLVDDDPVGLAERVEPLGGDLADDPDRQSGTREGL